MSKFNRMIDHLHMPEDQREQLKTDLMKQVPSKRIRSVWQRFAVAAALAVCLIGTAATIYAAYQYQWLNMFFNNGSKEADIRKENREKASTEKVIAQNKDYKYTVLNHLYSKDQRMGLVLCSFKFLRDGNAYLNVQDKDQGICLTKDKILVDRDEIMKKQEEKYVTPLHFHIEDLYEMPMSSASLAYFDHEMAEDGGYLIGIRYSISTKNKAEEPELALCLENSGNLKARLPKSKDIESIRFVSEKKPEDFIDITSIGLTYNMTADKADDVENAIEYEDMKMVMKDQVKRINDVCLGSNDMISLVKETKTTNTWCLQVQFASLVDVSDIKYVEMDGDKFVR